MSGFNDTSDVNNPTFQDKLNEACKSAFKKYSNPPYDSWQELAHEVFIKVCSSKSFAEYRQITNEKGYLYSIAINHLIDKHKSPKTPPREKFVELDDVNLPYWTEKELRDRILTSEVLALLKGEDQFIILSWMDDKTWTEIAAALKVSEKTISKRFANIIKELKQRLKIKMTK